MDLPLAGLALVAAGWLAVIVPGAMFVAQTVRRRNDGVGPRARRILMRFAGALFILAWFTLKADEWGELMWLVITLALAGLGVGIWARVLRPAAAGTEDYTLARPWVPVLGMLVAFVTGLAPSFRGASLSKMVITQMKSDLRDLALAEEGFRQDSGRYTESLEELKFKPRADVNAPTVTAGKTWFIASNSHRRWRGAKCQLAVSDTAKAARSGGMAEPVCR